MAKALSLPPGQVIEEVIKSGLRGRGGAGFPTGTKWKACRDAEGTTKYIVANGSEGDPDIGMHRSMMEGDPHSVLEGMMIAIIVGGTAGLYPAWKGASIKPVEALRYE